MNLTQAIQWGQQTLTQRRIISASLDARLLLCHVTSLSREDLIRSPELIIGPDELQSYKALIRRRESREPVAYLVGRREFWGLEIECETGVLIPRPDSETLVSLVVKQIFDKSVGLNILDLGTGTGALLLALLHEFPNAKGVGTDTSPVAIALAQRNANRLGLADRARFEQTSWTDGIEGPFDLVISNPPYIASPDMDHLQRDVREYEPWEALSAGPDGLDAYREFSMPIGSIIRPFGRLAIEIGQGQAEEVKWLFEQAGFSFIEGDKDLNGIIRALSFEKV